MKYFARLEGGYVVERLDVDELPPFHESLRWVECEEDVQVGWYQSDASAPLVAPVISLSERGAAERQWRDIEISRVRWLCERHRDEVDLGLATTLSVEQFRELLIHVQALRDWPQSQVFPASEQRPVAPSWLAGAAQ
ncbi:hypothetical protein AB3464_23150 [Pseudomonas asplenii]|uniref:Caudovirales tail fiber assembly protein n=1 Tax=Pseudomonas asplenii TaxID=53407 RepID=A0A1H6NKR5_9PSED|nr:hypothetical protein [Pseudomonas fuscovaginae]SEI12804.1 hypothetical protein SAMN05216581_2525 [Pseudomonas fuscovaginae]